MTTHRYTRRRALQGAGVLVLGVGIYAVPAAGADAQSLDPTRAAALAALLAALAQGPAQGLDTEAYALEFDAYYADAPAPVRRYADETLDALIVETDLALAAPADAYRLLTAWATEPGRQRMVADGLALASLTFAEDELKTAGLGLVTGGTA